jgi:hypothetical protein
MVDKPNTHVFFFKGRFDDAKLMKKLSELNDSGYPMTIKALVPADQAVERLAKPAKPAPIGDNRFSQASYPTGKIHRKQPKRSTSYTKYHGFRSADDEVLRFVAEKGETSIDEICLHLSKLNDGNGYAMTTGATCVSKLVRLGKLIRDEKRKVVLA